MSYRAGAVVVLALMVALVTAGAAAGKKGSAYQTGYWSTHSFTGWSHAGRPLGHAAA